MKTMYCFMLLALLSVGTAHSAMQSAVAWVTKKPTMPHQQERQKEPLQTYALRRSPRMKNMAKHLPKMNEGCQNPQKRVVISEARIKKAAR